MDSLRASRSIPTELSADAVAHLLAGLKAIAAEQRFNHGPGEVFTVLPTHTGYEAMVRARSALTRAGIEWRPASPKREYDFKAEDAWGDGK